LLSQLQQQKLTRLFHVHDANGNGYVERDDYEVMVRRIAEGRGWGADAPEHQSLRGRVLAQWAAIAAAADPPGSGRVRLDGWLALWNAVLQAAYDDRVRGVSELLWETMDTDGDGRITRQESGRWFEAYGLSPADAGVAIAACDLNGDGFVSREEWLVLVDQFFLSMNPADPGNLLFGPLEGAAA
jgi:hypothetical protein